MLDLDGRSRQPHEAKDLSSFYQYVKDAIDDTQTDEGITTENKIILTEDYPANDMVTETISLGLVSRTPAGLGSGRPFQGHFKELRPGIRGLVDDPERPGHKMIIYGQQYENEVRFTCWAKTNKQANLRALWFEDLMKKYAWYYKYMGIMEVLFLRRDEDLVLDSGGQGNLIHGRPMLYYVRTERLTYLSEPTIRRVILRYRANTTEYDE